MKNIKNISLVALLATSIANSSLVLADQNPIFTAQDSKCTLEAEKIYKELNKKISGYGYGEKIEKLKILDNKLTQDLQTELTDNKKAILECLKSLINENITEIEKEKIMEETFINQINTFGLEQNYKVLSKIDIVLKNNKLSKSNKETLNNLKNILNKKIVEQGGVVKDDKIVVPLEYSGYSGGGGAGCVICTELTRQGTLDPKIWIGDEMYSIKNVSKETLKTYQLWATPIVKLMRESKIITNLIAPYGVAWANHMAFKMGMNDKDNWLGNHIFNKLLPIHEKVSKIIFSSKNEVIKNTSNQLNSNLPKPTIKDIFNVSLIYVAIPVVILPLFISSYFINKKSFSF